MIVRARRKTNYTIISNVGMEDPNLSLKAKGMLAYLLTKPDNWRVSDRQLSTIGPDGRTAVQAALKELEEAGYLRRERLRDDAGRWTHISYVYDEPTREENPWTDNPAPDNPAPDNPAIIISTVGTSTVRTKTVKERAATQPAAQDAPSSVPSEHQELFGAICDAVGWDYKTLNANSKGRVARAAGILKRANYTAADVREFMHTVWINDWRYKKNKSTPTIEQLQQEIGKLKNGNGNHNGTHRQDSQEVDDYDPEYAAIFAAWQREQRAAGVSV